MGATGPHVVHVTSSHGVFDTRIFHKECRSLARLGYRVTLVAPHARHETVDGVHVHALAVEGRRAARMFFGPMRALWAAFALRAHLYHLHDPELLPVAVILRLAGKRVVFDSHENFPLQALDRDWIPRRARWLARVVVAAGERLCFRACNAVISAEPVAAQRIKGAAVVRNLPLAEEFAVDRTSEAATTSGGVVYVGDITRSRGAVEMVRMAEHLALGVNDRLVLAGRVQNELREELEQLPGWNQVDFLGWLDRPAIVATLQRARVGLVTLHPTLKYQSALPVKMFEYMAAGLPVVASDFPLWREILEPLGAGVLVDPLDPEAIADAVRDLLRSPAVATKMGGRGRAAVLDGLSWEREATVLRHVYEGVLPRATRGQS